MLQGHPRLLRQQCAILREVRLHTERSPDGQLHEACCLVADTAWLLQDGKITCLQVLALELQALYLTARQTA